MATIHLTTQDFKEKIYDYEANPQSFQYKGELPAIVDFYASWCRPCQALGPVLEELTEEYAGKIAIYKVNVDENEDLSQFFDIRSIPTLLYIPTNGEQARIESGAPGKMQLKASIEKMIQK